MKVPEARLSLHGARRGASGGIEAEARLRAPSPGTAELCAEVTARSLGRDLAEWMEANATGVERLLAKHGAVYLRRFGVGGAEGFESTMRALYPALTTEHERSSPRSAVTELIYTSTDHDPEQPIVVHNELSYSATAPTRIAFYCQSQADEGGQTPLCDTRQVLAAIPDDVLDRFRRFGVLYVRNYGSGFGLDWPEAFGTTDRAQVEQYCERAGLTAAWTPTGLRTTRVGPAVVSHPVHGHELWFNHAVFFHVTSLEPELRDVLLADLAEDELPTNTYFGNGAAIPDVVLNQLRAAYRNATVEVGLQSDEVLVLDNLLISHGRRPFRGPRRVLVSMAEPIRIKAVT
jgi:alpha-ketoglutarate-dependent taurine dioxygenase